MFSARHRSIRLQGYDYTQAGAYFITICTHARRYLFGRIDSEEMQLSPAGQLVVEEWLQTAAIRPGVELDAFVVMPNHIHGIILLPDRPHPGDSLLPNPATSGALSTIVGAFKSAATRRIRAEVIGPGVQIWQPNYYDHIIRTESDLARIREYIQYNPARWADDQENLLYGL